MWISVYPYIWVYGHRMNPRNLDELRAMPAGPERIAAANAYIDERQAAIGEARALRNADIRGIADDLGTAATADLLGMKVPTVKAIRGQR